MSGRHETLAERKARLVARSGAERQRAASAVSAIRGSIARTDRGIQSVSRWVGRPAVLASGLATVLALGRRKPFRAASVALGLLSMGLKARRLGGAAPREEKSGDGG